jgi:serine protein kinase
MGQQTGQLSRWAARFDREAFNELNREMSFGEYLDLIYENPKLIRTAYQRIYDMIMSKGCYEYEEYRQKRVHYNFFDDEKIPIFGIEKTLDELVKFFRGAAGGYGTEKRVLLLQGPVGSSKSTICRLIKRSMEKYSREEDGTWYSYKWIKLPTGVDGIFTQDTDFCVMNEDPLKLVPPDFRDEILAEINQKVIDNTPPEKQKELYTLRCNGELNPRCEKFMADLLARYDGNWEKVVDNHVRVVRRTYSESKRIGIGTFQPKDEKNQDATELTGDINYRQLPHYGTDSDPRAFNFDGELNIANRGLVEFIEILKLDEAFLYDLLGASQEQQIKPKKFCQIPVDVAIVGHTNPPEYERLKNNQYMEALRDRTVKIDVPYLLRWKDEVNVLKQEYGPNKVRQHVAPHTIEMVALWNVLTRLEDDKEGKLDLVQKAKLYNGEMLPSYTPDSVKELMDKHSTEGMQGVSVRYAQDKISNCLANNHSYVNVFMVLHEIREGLDSSSLINRKDQLGKYLADVDLVIKEYTEIVKDEVRRALVGDEESIIRLCANYIDHLMAYVHKRKVRNKVTQRDEPPNERLMRSIEEKIEVPSGGIDDFRKMISSFIGDLSLRKETFRWDSNSELKRALEAKLFEDTKDHIKLSTLSAAGASVVQPDIQQKIDALKYRLIKQYGYNEESARDVLEFVGSIYARGEMADEKS